MPKYQAPRGTRDLLPAEMATWRRLEEVARTLSALYAFAPIETPLFEDSGVFERSIGQATDIVEKELFRVRSPRGDEDRWALRPEATAGVARAYVQHAMHTLPQPVRLTTFGPMFRYDRPQAGRFREFWQWNVEAIGDAGPAIDAEIVELAYRYYHEVGVENLVLNINSIGDSTCRPAYVAALAAYFERFADELPATEQGRLRTSPLRLLDSKEARMKPLIEAAPLITDYLCDTCQAHFDAVLAHLDALEVGYALTPRLVRGFDYYTRTTFEFYQQGAEGQQSALGGGGRYDGLLELFGARPTPGIGFALGIDRIALAVSGGDREGARAEQPLVVVVGADPSATVLRLRLASDLRAAGVPAQADLGVRKLGRQLEGAARAHAHFAVVVGDELDAGQVQLRDLEAGTQRLANVADLARELQRAAAGHHHG